MSVLSQNFPDVMARLEERAAAGLGHDAVFEGLDDDLFTFIAGKDYDDYPAIKAILPDFPPAEVVGAITGGRGLRDAMKEATLFWRRAKEVYAGQGRRPLREATVVDNGCGWGRITRLCGKDAGQVFAVEPDPAFRDLFRDKGVSGILVAADFLSSEPLGIEGADLLFSFSVMTHASEQLACNIRDRWTEIMAPGGVVLFTIRPGDFLNGDRGEIRPKTPEELAQGRAAYDAGRPAYWAYESTPDFGITVMPMAYLHELFDKDFEILGPRFLLENPTQLPIAMVRR